MCYTSRSSVHVIWFSLYKMYLPVLQLTIYLPGMHMVAYNERDDLRNVINYE
jgi:hypothetical protein